MPQQWDNGNCLVRVNRYRGKNVESLGLSFRSKALMLGTVKLSNPVMHLHDHNPTMVAN